MKVTKQLDQEAVSNLVEASVTAHNIAGFTPVTSVFRLVPEQLKKVLFDCAHGFLSDIKMVTLDIDYKRGIVGAFVWLPDDSEHVRDTSTMNEKSALRKVIHRYSQPLKEFMDRFSPNDSKRAFRDETNMHLVGIPVMIDRMLLIVFDAKGDRFSKTYGLQTPIKTRIRLSANFAKGEDNRTYGKLRYIELTKSVDSDFVQREPRAKKSFKV